ncbi:hypothetical protein DL762_006084 [Monosporascus cannonballus]|uniref:Nucleoside phosphorylase domain-containing protein n=1 Tax=Monosporascus cannonballus TaxID=155416 RepID=A0ABY0H301_9PEZI|nr:hypothetical protein DL762_006084 [Monosporascus cannonballus]RYO88006.1 hypothetical protein DL763_006158 [Monosporascus cannonballus]
MGPTKFAILSTCNSGQPLMLRSRKLTHDAYTVGWVAVLHCELNASRLLLDEKHEPLQSGENDDNSYLLGRMGAHNVVITFPGSGTYGTNAAAQVVTNMVRTFRNIRFGLLVGVGGGAPRPPNSKDATKDIRLGDIIVSDPKGKHGGVLQYDMGKWGNDQDFSIESHLNKPPGILLKAMQLLRSDHDFGEGEMNQYIQQVTVKASKRTQFREYLFPGRDQDQLFKANRQHSGEDDCSDCRATGLTEKRLDRDSDEPAVHYGLIASANAVMRSAQRRNELRDKWNVSCFEMEAAGLMDNFPCVVIRGICDYSDDHKNKVWQPYAAVAAAAYAKDLLRIIQATEVTAIPPAVEDLPGRGRAVPQDPPSPVPTVFGYAGFVRLDILNRLSDADLRRLKIRIPQVLAELARDVNWSNWHRVIDNLNSEFHLGLLSSDKGEYEGRNWREWKAIHNSASESDYARTVAFRNRMGQWCNNNKYQAGCGVIWLTFVLELHDVLQEYKPHVR